MKVLNIIWGFGSGGIGKCFLTYNKMGEACPDIEVHSVCIDIGNRTYDRSALLQNNIDIIPIKSPVDLSWIKNLKKHIQARKPNVLFTHGFNGPVIAWVVKKIYNIKIPLVCSYHGPYHPPTRLKKLASPLYNYVQPRLYRTSAAQIITVENQSKKQLIQKGVPENKITTVYNGIPDKYFSDEPVRKNENTLRLLIASRLDKIKGIEYVLNSLPLVLDKISVPIQLNIVGDGPEYENLRTLTRKLDIQHVVSFKGYQNNIKEWLSNTDIFLLPSLSECHSIALLEAMQAGKAIIATSVGGNPESIRHGNDGIIVPPENPEAIADALIKLSGHPELLKKLGKNAQQRFLDNFTESRMLSNLTNVFISLQ